MSQQDDRLEAAVPTAPSASGRSAEPAPDGAPAAPQDEAAAVDETRAAADPATSRDRAPHEAPAPSPDEAADAGPATSQDGAPDDDSAEVTPPLPALLEAVLLVTDEPVAAATLAQVTEASLADVERTLHALASDYVQVGRGFELRLVAGGWRLYTRADCAAHVERFLLDGQSARLTQAALETLAVIAYQQPVTRGRVSAVRGVNVDGVVRTLQTRGLITEAGQDSDTAGTLFRTTPLLLERLGLRSLDELPPLAPLLPELDELDDASTST